VEKQAEVEEQRPVSAVDAPMTPDSRASIPDKSEAEAPVLAPSPANSADDHVEHTARPDAGSSLPPTPPVVFALFSSEYLLNHHLSTAPENSQTNGISTTPTAAPPLPQPVTNGVHRKLTIPSKLPPPFYPSQQFGTSMPPATESATTHISLHRSNLSAGAAAFSTSNGASTAPATTHDADQNSQSHQPTLPRSPGFSPPEFTPSFVPGHSHHPSGAGAQLPHRPPYPDAPPNPVHVDNANYRAPLFASAVATFPDKYDDNISPEGALSGVTTSHTQSPSKSHFGEPGSEQEEELRTAAYRNGTGFHAERLEESAFELAAYLSTQFGNPEFADFVLQIRSPESILVSIPVHAIVVVRSPTIAEATRRSVPTAHRSRDVRRLIDVLTSDTFVTRDALEEAIKVLYGAPLLSAQSFLYGITPYVYDNDQSSASNDAQRRMQQLLSYIAAGRALQIPSMQACGLQIAQALIRWDTVDQVLHFALQSSSSARGRAGVGSEDVFTATLLNSAIEFMAYTFPVDFKLYTIAPELREIPRLPVTLESRPPAHNPRLSKIRFGDAPPEDDLQPTHASRMLSSILMSLPLQLVDRLFNHRATANQVGWTGATRIMREVIDERENRRRKAMDGQPSSSHDGAIPSALLINLHTEERVDSVDQSPVHPSGYRLTRHHRPAGEV
jgi:hypothetical protein